MQCIFCYSRCCSSFSSVATSTSNWPMIDLLQNKDKSLDWTASAFKFNQLKRKWNMESTVWKYIAESIVHSIWKGQGNYIMSLLMPEWTSLRVIILLIVIYTFFHFLDMSLEIAAYVFSSFWFYNCYYYCHLSM